MIDMTSTRLKDLSCRHLFEASEDGLVVLTPSLQVLEANSIAQQLLLGEQTFAEQKIREGLFKLLLEHGIETKQICQTPLTFNWSFQAQSYRFISIPLKNAESETEGAMIRLKNLNAEKVFEQHLHDAQWRYNKLLALSERRAEEISLLHSVRDALNSAPNRDSICRIVVERSSEIYGYNLVSLYLVVGQELHMQHQVGYETFIERLNIHSGVMGKVARTARATLINPDCPDPDLIWAFEGIQAEVCVPILIDGQVIGVFNIESLDTHLTEADLNLATTLAAYISSAFERITLLETLQEREKKYRELVENADDIIYNISLSGYFLYVNPATERLTGYSQEQLKHLHFLNLIRPDFQARAMQMYEEQFKTRLETSQFIFPLITAKGEERWLSQKVRLVWKEGRILHMQAYSRDITEQVYAEQALASHAKALERANNDLAKFSFVSAHDLQEPLRKIRTFSDRLQQKYAVLFDAQAHRYLNRIDEAAKRMQRLLEEVQLFSHIGSELKEEAIDLNSLVRTWLEQNAVRLDQLGAKVSLDSLTLLKADGHHMRLLIHHLLENALKFHRKDQPLELDIRQNQTEDWLELRFNDNGQGFEDTYLDRIFEVFQTLHSDKENLGNGMGLALCRKIVTVYGGSISAKSQKGQGSSFLVRLPKKLIIDTVVDAERLVGV